MAAEGGDPLDSAQRLLAEHDDREHAWRQAWAEAEASGDARLPAATTAGGDALTIMRGRLLLASDPQRVRDVAAPASALPGMVGVRPWLPSPRRRIRCAATRSPWRRWGSRSSGPPPDASVPPSSCPAPGRVVEILRRHLELVGTHAAFVEEVLSVVDRAPTATREKPRAAEPLTDRERETVVGYLPTMRSNAEIAEALQIGQHGEAAPQIGASQARSQLPPRGRARRTGPRPAALNRPQNDQIRGTRKIPTSPYATISTAPSFQ